MVKGSTLVMAILTDIGADLYHNIKCINNCEECVFSDDFDGIFGNSLCTTLSRLADLHDNYFEEDL